MRLTAYMAATRVTGNEIARKSGINPSIVSKMLAGKSQPTARTIRRLIDHYPMLTAGGIFADYFEAAEDAVDDTI